MYGGMFGCKFCGKNFPSGMFHGLSGEKYTGKCLGKLSRWVSVSPWRITSLYVQQLWVELPWLTHRHTGILRPSISPASWTKNTNACQCSSVVRRPLIESQLQLRDFAINRFFYQTINKKLIMRWDSEREL